MISHELAKELKDAGWPQQTYLHCQYFNKSGVCLSVIDGSEEVDAVAPDLSELIEAVKGDKMHTFELSFAQEWALYEPVDEEGPWAARYYDLTPVGFYETGAKTPEEAVARLWLALNRK